MDDFRIDSHKLMYHIDRVHEWLHNGDCFPIYIEIAPSGKCQHRCIFCALDYLGYKNPFLDEVVLGERLKEMAGLGVKAVMYAGEGEPLLHRNIGRIVNLTKKVGIDVSVTTNGVALNGDLVEECLGSLSWVRVSVDAATPETYARIHGCHERDFHQVISNLATAVKVKKDTGCRCTIGAQLLLLADNLVEAVPLAVMLRDIGVDYFTIKPYSQHPSSGKAVNAVFEEAQLAELGRQLRLQATDKFRVVFRRRALGRVGKRKWYKKCLGLPFFAYIASTGDVYTCSTFLGDQDFCYGNIYEQSFSEIWKGQRRREVLRRVAGMDIAECRENCRLDEINSYLHRLKHLSAHDNFI